jgi:hypothetical protein
LGLEEKVPNLRPLPHHPEPQAPTLDLFDRIADYESQYAAVPKPVADALKRQDKPVMLGQVTYLRMGEEYGYGRTEGEYSFRVTSTCAWNAASWHALQQLANRYSLAIQDGRRDGHEVVELSDKDLPVAAIRLDPHPHLSQPPSHRLYIARDHPLRDTLFLALIEEVYHADLGGRYQARPCQPPPAPTAAKRPGFLRRLLGGG